MVVLVVGLVVPVVVLRMDQLLPVGHSFSLSSSPVVPLSISSTRCLTTTTPQRQQHHSWRLYARRTVTLVTEEQPRTMVEVVTTESSPLHHDTTTSTTTGNDDDDDDDYDITRHLPTIGTFSTTTMMTTMIPVLAANAAVSINLNSFQSGLTVENFQPVCGASDNVYRVLQQSISAIVGPDKFVEYGPLIAGGLLRVRLELCVVESFITEAVVPFIRDNGVSWILPLHETVETFLAGAIFAVATTFILIGSTKLVTVLVTYTDFVFGLPSRLFGGFVFDRAQGKPITLDVGLGPLQTRIVGPPKDQEWPALKVEEISPLAWLVLLTSGTINYFGKTLQVCVNL